MSKRALLSLGGLVGLCLLMTLAALITSCGSSSTSNLPADNPSSTISALQSLGTVALVATLPSSTITVPQIVATGATTAVGRIDTDSINLGKLQPNLAERIQSLDDQAQVEVVVWFMAPPGNDIPPARPGLGTPVSPPLMATLEAERQIRGQEPMAVRQRVAEELSLQGYSVRFSSQSQPMFIVLVPKSVILQLTGYPEVQSIWLVPPPARSAP